MWLNQLRLQLLSHVFLHALGDISPRLNLSACLPYCSPIWTSRASIVTCDISDPFCSGNKRLLVAFSRAVNSLKARETPMQEQICIKKHKNVKLQDTHNLAKGSQKRVQMMMQSPNDYVFSFLAPARPYNRDTNKKNRTANLDWWPPARVIKVCQTRVSILAKTALFCSINFSVICVYELWYLGTWRN